TAWVDREDPTAILACLDPNAPVELEPGMVMAELVAALAPWSDIWTRMGGIDLRSWLRAYERGKNCAGEGVARLLFVRVGYVDPSTGTSVQTHEIMSQLDTEHGCGIGQ